MEEGRGRAQEESVSSGRERGGGKGGRGLQAEGPECAMQSPEETSWCGASMREFMMTGPAELPVTGSVRGTRAPGPLSAREGRIQGQSS